jgi:LysM domain
MTVSVVSAAPSRQYEVQDGDSFWKIAQKHAAATGHAGDKKAIAAAWVQLLKANSKENGGAFDLHKLNRKVDRYHPDRTNPNYIRPKQTLSLPATWQSLPSQQSRPMPPPEPRPPQLQPQQPQSQPAPRPSSEFLPPWWGYAF